MMLLCTRALLIAAAGIMVAPSAGWAGGKNQTRPMAAPAMPVPLPKATAAVPCGQRTDVVKMLRETYGETQIAHGLSNTGAVAEVFISAKGTWTIVATAPNGMTCMVGSGDSWQPEVASDGTI